MSTATTSDLTTRRRAAVAMTAAAIFATAGFVELGAIFDYPAILDEPTAVILAEYRQHRSGVTTGFTMLIVGGALLAPIAVLLARLADRRRRWIVATGIAAATVQVVGLSRWIVVVPRISRRRARPGPGRRRARPVRGAAHVARAVRRGDPRLRAHRHVHRAGDRRGRRAAAIGSALGMAAAALIASGTLTPLGIDAASLTNFAGYILWTVWLVAVAADLVRGRGSTWRPVVPFSRDSARRAGCCDRGACGGPLWLDAIGGPGRSADC